MNEWKYNYITDYIKKNVYNEWSSDEAPFSSSEVMLVDVLDRTEEKGFVDDIMSWLRRSAPRKVAGFLKGLTFPMKSGQISYENLCESVYDLGFRADEIIERRMILGPSNWWTRLYFEEFPLAQ